MGSSFQSYGVSPAICNHNPTQVNAPHLNPNMIGWYSIYLSLLIPDRMEG